MSDTTTKSWAKRIHEAEKRGGFTEQDIKDAWFWGACAIGEYPDEVKASLTEYFEANDYGDGRGAFYEPSQMTLIEHGCNFGGAVAAQDWQQARIIRRRIQAWFRRHRFSGASA